MAAPCKVSRSAILIAGPDAGQRKLFRYALEGAGYLVVEASGVQAHAEADPQMLIAAVVQIGDAKAGNNGELPLRLVGIPRLLLSEGTGGASDPDTLSVDCSPRELVLGLRRLLARDGWLKIGPLRLNPSARRLLCEGKRIDVSEREFDVLHLLMLNAGRELMRSEIQRLVWGAQECNRRAVDVCIRRIREALGVHGPMIETVRLVGYSLALPGEAVPATAQAHKLSAELLAGLQHSATS